MIEYRPFRNSDTPALVDVWRSQPSQRGLMQPMSAAVFEQLVLAKPYFDREGLILATGREQVLGFVHAGFGPSDDRSTLSTEPGVVSRLVLRRADDEAELAAELLSRAEQYLHDHGAQTIVGGEVEPLSPFYLGLYGGSQMSGILDSDARTQGFFRAGGYREAGRMAILHRDLAGFRPVVDRKQMQIRRRTNLQILSDPPTSNWWEACTLGGFDRLRFELQTHDCGPPLAEATFWNIEPLAITWGVHAAGLINLDVPPAERRHGLATYLMGEAFCRLMDQGISMVEVHVGNENPAAHGLFAKLGFTELDKAIIYRKD